MSKRHGPLLTAVRKYGARHGFDDYWSTGSRVQVRRLSRKAALDEHTRISALISNGRKDLTDLNAAELAEFREWKKRTHSTLLIEDAVKLLLDQKRHDKDAKRKWMRVLKDYLELVSDHFGGRRLSDITTADYEAMMRDRGLPQRTWNNQRGAIVQLERWAVRERHLPADHDQAKRIKRFKIRKTATITHWEPHELAQQLAAASDDDRPWYLLGNFAGVRTEELMPEYKDKDPLRWEDFDWDERIIRMRPETSKVNEARNVPISRQLAAWLRPYLGRHGPVIPIGRRPRVITRRVEKAGGLPHRINANRHTYGTFRRMEVQNVEQVAEEMGTGIYKVKIHYSRPKNPSALVAFKAIMPAEDGKIVEMPKSKPPRTRNSGDRTRPASASIK